MRSFCWALAAACTWASIPPAVPPAAEAAYLRGAGLRKQAAALPSGSAEWRRVLGQAAEALGRAVAEAPEVWQHHHALGEVYMDQGRWSEAVQEFLTTTKLDSKVASAFLHLGRSLREMPGYDDKSREALLIAARLNNDYAELDPVSAQRSGPLFP
jgi:cytochrome c-type biogenesis protein CcmH/NrfG